MVVLPAKREVLAGHVIEGCRDVPCLVRITWIFREIGRSRSCCCTVNRRQEHEVATRIVDFSTPKSDAVAILREPEPVVDHESNETLLRSLRRVPPATHSSPVLTAQVAR